MTLALALPDPIAAPTERQERDRGGATTAAEQWSSLGALVLLMAEFSRRETRARSAQAEAEPTSRCALPTSLKLSCLMWHSSDTSTSIRQGRIRLSRCVLRQYSYSHYSARSPASDTSHLYCARALLVRCALLLVRTRTPYNL